MMKNIEEKATLEKETETPNSNKKPKKKKPKKASDGSDEDSAEMPDDEDEEREQAKQRQACAKANLLNHFPEQFDNKGYHPEMSGKVAAILLSLSLSLSLFHCILSSFFLIARQVGRAGRDAAHYQGDLERPRGGGVILQADAGHPAEGVCAPRLQVPQTRRRHPR
jgi:hypothetical protein